MDSGHEPSPIDLLAAGIIGITKASFGVAAKAIASLTRPERALEDAKVTVEGLGEIVWAAANPAPPSPLNVEIGPHRRFAGIACELADFKAVKNAFGGTVNDVVLAVVAGALRHWLHSRGVRTQGLELCALVPVSVRHRDGDSNGAGNRLAVMRGPLPVYVEDPVERLAVVRAAMDDLKESKQAVGAEVLTSMQQFAPPTVLAQASRLNFSTRLFNLLVTNVPGPQFPLYVQGREMTSVFPIAFLPKNHALAIAIMSYNGQMNFGLLGDYDAMPDLDAFGEAIESGRRARVARRVGEARAAAPAASPSGERARASKRFGLDGIASRLPALSMAIV